jgi:DNA-binding NarL/FixJ family response regulator
MIVATDLKIRLEIMSYTIVGIVSNGKDAIKKCRETRPDLILMDILLKGNIDGIETAQIINKLFNIPFIYLTGNYDKAIFKRAETTKPSGYLNKPFDGTELQTAIKTAINTQKSKYMPKRSEYIKKK